jgi:prepilin-type N-terminal cleavage/methylation domain-containing protein
MKNLKSAQAHKKGFSLVELLVVIAVIGVIAAIAIPAMSGIFTKSRETKNRRNAQSIVSIYSAALNAGVSGIPTLTTGNNAAAAESIVAHFRTPQKGVGIMDSARFHIDLGPNEVIAAAAYLTAQGNPVQLTYTAGGDETN